nr:extensin family protein [uncultured Celeribacter sp.]
MKHGRHILWSVLALLACSEAALAEGLTRPVPELRPAVSSTRSPVVSAAATGLGQARPELRPGRTVEREPSGTVESMTRQAGLGRSPRPVFRPAFRSATARARATAVAQPAPKATYGRQGSVCGVAAIHGRTVSAISGPGAGCGIAQPVQVTQVSGVTLSTPAVVDCTTARTLNTWVSDKAEPLIGRLGGGIAQLQIAASYACRPRNNQNGAKLSEHAKGHAVDISAFVLKNGVRLSVLNDWNKPVEGKLLRQLHRSACGPFGTVLGPESDRHHKDHFHFDTARYRAGSYCR